MDARAFHCTEHQTTAVAWATARSRPACSRMSASIRAADDGLPGSVVPSGDAARTEAAKPLELSPSEGEEAEARSSITAHVVREFVRREGAEISCTGHLVGARRWRCLPRPESHLPAIANQLSRPSLGKSFRARTAYYRRFRRQRLRHRLHSSRRSKPRHICGRVAKHFRREAPPYAGEGGFALPDSFDGAAEERFASVNHLELE
jgi:hypothetical protein